MSPLPASVSPSHFAINWLQAIVFFISLEPHQGLAIYKRLLRELLAIAKDSASLIVDPKIISNLYINVGLIHGFLGEHYEARNSFEEATSHDETSILAWFALGCARSQLSQFTRAGQAFFESRRQLNLLNLEGSDPGIYVDFYEMMWTPPSVEMIQGLKPRTWFLNRTRIEWNIRMAFINKLQKAENTVVAGNGMWGSNGIPAGTIIAPPLDSVPGGEVMKPSPANAVYLTDSKPLPPLPPFLPPRPLKPVMMPAPIDIEPVKMRLGNVRCHKVSITTPPSLPLSPPPASILSPPLTPISPSRWGPSQWQPWKSSGNGELFFVPDFNTIRGPNDPDTPILPVFPRGGSDPHTPLASVFPARRSSLEHHNHRQSSVYDGFILPATRYEPPVTRTETPLRTNNNRQSSVYDGYILPATRYEPPATRAEAPIRNNNRQTSVYGGFILPATRYEGS
ncbi:hypothetical protein MMC14_009680 [Varicellaria rhodocarpa]|nr:hypothetical protein [Varicellaria rhodocarpa]